jgi:hypothetical protein
MMKNALIEKLIAVEVRGTPPEPSTQDWQSTPFTFISIKSIFKDLVISQTEIGRVWTTYNNDIL